MKNTKRRDRQDWMRRKMRLLALEFDADARFTVLATHLGVKVDTIARWIKRGRMPLTTAEGLELRFGVDLAPAKQLADQ